MHVSSGIVERRKMSIDKAGSLIKVKGQNDIITIAIDFTTSVIAHFTLKKDVE